MDRRFDRRGPRRGWMSVRVAGFLIAAYVAVLLFIVLWPSSIVANHAVWSLWWWLHEAGAPTWVSARKIEFGLNILLFMPLSFLGSIFRPGWGWGSWLLVGLLATTAIELGQLVLLPGRSASGVDLAANTLGAVAGYALATMTGVSARAARYRV